MKPTKVTVAQLAEITKSYAMGAPEILIAHELGMHEATWQRLKKRDPRVGEALALGKAKQEHFYHRNLMRMADKNVAACIFPLKARHAWQESQPTVDESQRIVFVPFQMPATLTDEQYAKTIEGEVVREEPARLGDATKDAKA